MVVNSYLNFVAGFAVLLQLQSGVPGAGILSGTEKYERHRQIVHVTSVVQP